MAAVLLRIRILGSNHLKIVQRGLRGGRFRRELPISSDISGYNVQTADVLVQLEREAESLRTKFDSVKHLKQRKDEGTPQASSDPDKNSKYLGEQGGAQKAKLNNDKHIKASESHERTTKYVWKGERNPNASQCNGRNPKASRSYERSPESNDNKELVGKWPASGGVYADLIKDLRSKANFAEVTLENKDEKIKDAMTILHSFPYGEQLRLKYHKNIDVLRRLSRGLDYNVKKRCQVEKVIRSPMTDNYRSKDEFSVQVGVDGKPTVGFFVGNPKDGLVCVEPDPINIIKDSHKVVAKCYQNYIRQSSLPPHLYMGPIAGGQQGNWRSMYVKSNEAGDLMAKIIFHPQQLEEQRMQEEKEKLVEYFTSGDGRVCDLKSLYIVVTKDMFNSASKDRPQLLFGSKHITETMDGITFRLGPETFYQINVKCAELLLGVVNQQANLDETRTLLDICCGAGFFSIHMAHLARGCMGVDMLGIEDARENAELNGINNCSFLKGKVQEVVPGLLQQIGPIGGAVSVVLNPGREGVDFRVIRELRRSRMVDSIVYVSCQPEGKAFINLHDLLKEDSKKTPANLRSEPFQLQKAIPIDMFPHTQHCEHVFVFRR